MAKECEFCGYQEAKFEDEDKPDRGLYRLTYSLDPQKERYILCANCSFALVTLSLSPQQFLRAKEKGGDTNRFYLHDDFYDPETGQALQPSTGKANISGKARRGNKNFEALRKKGEVHKVTPDKNASPEKLRQVASSLKLTGPIDIRAIPSE